MARKKADQLGELERSVMEHLWAEPAGLTVRELDQRFRDHAYTTILTVCDRLATKEFVRRELLGRSFRYYAMASKEAYITSLMEAALAASGVRSAALAHFVQEVDAQDLAVIRSALRRRR